MLGLVSPSIGNTAATVTLDIYQAFPIRYQFQAWPATPPSEFHTYHTNQLRLTVLLYPTRFVTNLVMTSLFTLQLYDSTGFNYYSLLRSETQ